MEKEKKTKHPHFVELPLCHTLFPYSTAPSSNEMMIYTFWNRIKILIYLRIICNQIKSWAWTRV